MVATMEPGASRSGEAPDPVALGELLDHVPERPGPRPTGPDGGTAVGTDTGIAGDEPAVDPPVPAPPRLRVGRARYLPLLSNPAIERAARAQIYSPLRICAEASNPPPPPESITLSFTLRPDGSVDPASVGAIANKEALDEVAACVVRTFSKIPFRGPAAAHGTSPRVVILWPSVD